MSPAKEKVQLKEMKVLKGEILHITMIISWLHWLPLVVQSKEEHFCYILKSINK